MQSTALLTELIKLVLWLLESSHQSGRINAVMFLSNALTFKAFLDIFDDMDGLRKLYNVVSGLFVFMTAGKYLFNVAVYY